MTKKKIEVNITAPQGYWWENIFWGRDYGAANFDAKEFELFANQSDEDIKKACCDKNGRLKHVIRAEHFDLPTLETLCQTARAARTIAKLEDKSLKGILTAKSVLNYFNQPSSRTFLSFSKAQRKMRKRTPRL